MAGRLPAPRTGIRFLTLTVALAALILAPPPAGAVAGGPCIGASASVSAHISKRALTRAGDAIRCLLARERRERGLRALRPAPALRHASERHARDMVRRHYFAHRSLGGRRVQDRAQRIGYLRGVRRWELGEALAWGAADDASPVRLVRRLLASRPHRDLLLDRAFRDVGVGVAYGAPIPGGRRLPGLTVTLTFGHVVRR